MTVEHDNGEPKYEPGVLTQVRDIWLKDRGTYGPDDTNPTNIRAALGFMRSSATSQITPFNFRRRIIDILVSGPLDG